MKGGLRAALILGIAMWLSSPCALAHHSGAMFDRQKTVPLEGTVKEFQYTNPHCWILLLVPRANGEAMEWDVEGSAPMRLTGWGLTPDTLKAGDKVSLRIHPLKDGRHGGSLIDITLASRKYIKTS
jgi:hypothetical protein